ncbi:MAG: IS66 family transposase [bacterium]
MRQQAPGKGRCDTCRFWTIVGQPGTAGHYVLFDYTQGRSRAGPERWFRDPHDQPLFVEGELQCDAYAGYGSNSGGGAKGGLLDPNGPWRMVHIGCWAHARRKFHDARLAAPGPACHAYPAVTKPFADPTKHALTADPLDLLNATRRPGPALARTLFPLFCP